MLVLQGKNKQPIGLMAQYWCLPCAEQPSQVSENCLTLTSFLINRPREKDLALRNMCSMFDREPVHQRNPSWLKVWWESSARQRCCRGLLKGLEIQMSSRCLFLTVTLVIRTVVWEGVRERTLWQFLWVCPFLPSSCFVSAVKSSLKQQGLLLAVGPYSRLREQAWAGGSLQSLETAEEDGLKFSSSDGCRNCSRT